jgi:PAS domain S-box-containing protein
MADPLNGPESLPDSLRLLTVVTMRVPVGVQIYDHEGRSVFVNEHFCKMFGAPPPPSYRVLNDELAEAAGAMEPVRKAYQGQRGVTPIFWYDPRELQADPEYTKKYGKRCGIQTELEPVFGKDGKVTHVVFFHRDVTAELFMQEERERALKERDDARSLVQKVLDQTQAVIYIKDLEGRFIFVNGQFCRIFELTQAQIIGKADHDLFPKAIADHFRANDLRVQETRSHIEIEEDAIHSDGTTHTYLSLKFPLDDSAGALHGVCGISTDLTQYRRMERELNQAKRMEAVGLLAGGVAHNFNNSIGVILLLADTLLMQKPGVSAPWHESVEAIKSAARGASFLTRQLLAFGRRQVRRPVVLDLATVVAGVEEILRRTMGEGIKFKVEAAEVIPVLADAFEVEQILMNLCLNARDAMPSGGDLNLRLRRVRISAEESEGFPWRFGQPSGDLAEMSVTDTGTGMAAEVASRIFEPFFTTKADGQGSGLGLATVQGIIEGAGGGMTVKTSPGSGTAFSVYLPLAQGAPRTEAAPSPSVRSAERGTETVLLVEDHGSLRHITASLLREHGYTVLEARDARSALEIWAVSGSNVDLIVTDVVMPGMGAYEMVARIEEASGKPVKTLFTSAYSRQRIGDHKTTSPAAHFLEKPYGGAQLLAKVREILDS